MDLEHPFRDPNPYLTDLILDTWMKEKRIRAKPFNRGRRIQQGLDLQRLMDAAANVWFFWSDKMSFSFAFRNEKYLS